MSAVLLQPVERRWACPNCATTSVTREVRPHTQMHACAGLVGLTAPMTPAGMKCKVVAVEREDYVRDELVRTNAEGRPIMAVVTVRDDGQDCAVFAPRARLTPAATMDVLADAGVPKDKMGSVLSSALLGTGRAR